MKEPAAARFRFESIEIDARGRRLRSTAGCVDGLRLALASDVELDLVRVPGGELEMGSPDGEAGRWRAEGPQRRVQIGAFLLGRFPVTQALWRWIAAEERVERDLAPEPSRFPGAARPVENVSWLDAAELCARLARCSGLPFRLPSEAEWEYACRAGTTTAFHCGATLSPDAANYDCGHAFSDEPTAKPRGETTPVGRFPANAFGLHDVHGNVFEWCADAWHPHYSGAPSDGAPWLADAHPNYRALRGGAWCTRPQGCRSAYRTAAHQRGDHRSNAYGLRVALAQMA